MLIISVYQTWNNSEIWMAAKLNAFLFEAVYAFDFVMVPSICTLFFFLNLKQFCTAHKLLVVGVRALVVVLKDLWWGRSSS